ncbi:hypothetical protein [Streptomyces sp. NBRC 110028]|uniref:hypothetical protein n=1 Tax=Streptomyces sp. NBRC 110028 TaxID=1621260 RepID=UPI0006E21C52|nr:hypothetical protein [Streptomyces sp. NBRC 110028]
METPDTPDTFDKELCDLVIDFAPRLFAVVQEYDVEPGLRDGVIAAWGLAFDDGAVRVASVDGTRQLTLNSPERAIRYFGPRADGSLQAARLVWLTPSRTATLLRAEHS